MTPETASWLDALLSRVKFHPTEYIRPHEYIIKGWSKDARALFKAIEDAIKEHGYDRRFFRKTYRYVNHAGYKYWIIDDVLNREKLPDAVSQP